MLEKENGKIGKAATVWTADRIERLVEMWKNGVMSSDIGRRLGISKNAVIGKVHRLRLPPRMKAVSDKTGKEAEIRESQKIKEKMDTAKEDKFLLCDLIGTPPGVTDFLTLTSQMCSFPMGDPAEEDFQFCCKDKVGSYSYCQEHMKEAYANAKLAL